MDKLFYCCQLNTNNNLCRIYGTNWRGEISLSGLPVTSSLIESANHIAWPNIIPRNLREWNNGGVRMSTQCVGDLKQSYAVDDTLPECLENFRTWRKQ